MSGTTAIIILLKNNKIYCVSIYNVFCHSLLLLPLLFLRINKSALDKFQAFQLKPINPHLSSPYNIHTESVILLEDLKS